MASILAPLLVCLIGAVVALIPNRGSMLGVVAFGVGLFWCVAATRWIVVHF